jgi:acetylglutamate kinase
MLVVKYGGNAMGIGSDDFLSECAELVKSGVRMVLVHGGGPQIDAAVRERGIPEERVAGLRVTDQATLAIAEGVLCASVNKALVRGLLRLGVQAVGLSGEDAGLLIARQIAPIREKNDSEARSLGYVGEIESVRPAVLTALLDAGFMPVIAPLGVAANFSEYYNLNADTAAGAIAGELGRSADASCKWLF